MKIKRYCQVIGSVLVVSMLLGGCDNSAQEYEQAMEKAKQNVKNEEYEAALEDLDTALEYKDGDKEAENLSEQVSLLLKAESAKKDNDYSGQMKNLDKIKSIETDSGVVKDKADEYKSEAEEFTLDEAKEIAETKAGIDKNDKAYLATYFEYDSEHWIHQGFYVYADDVK